MEQLHITISNEQKKIMQEEAKSKGLSLSAYIRLILSERNK